jgi:hypothetical protein
MAGVSWLGPWLAALGSVRPALAFFRGGIGRGWSTGVGGILVETRFEGIHALQEERT